jgi:acyl transferase domain-containing protein/SAM-dependent methyltransferase/acyl carrier protein
MSSNNNSLQEELSPLKRALAELRRLRSKLNEMDRRQKEPIAIVGFGLRFPGGAIDEFSLWQILAQGINTVTEIPGDRWNLDAYYDPDADKPGKMYTRHGAYLSGVDQFDAEFFGVSPREATSMDPQHRLLLETSWEALENAAIAPATLRDSQTGVFVGIGNSDYWRMVYADEERVDAYSALGNSYSVAAGRLSYFFGAHGPSMAIDTACSSSLVAVHQACRSLHAGECNLALAAGVNLILSPEANINFCKSRMLAPDGRCKTFDAGADGYVRGEGCGVVVLKMLSSAKADGDRILAVIRGSAVNQDGRSGGLTAPNGPAQEAVIREALAAGGVAPHEISYLEAHGTGTSLGDPIEVQAACAALCQGRPADQPLALGSIKTNIGHLEAAAGVAGLLKVILALQHKSIPPHLHLTKKNPYIDWDRWPIFVPTALTPWNPVNGKRIAGLSSFSFSGTNAHLIVEEAPEPVTPRVSTDRPIHILALSARDRKGLQQLANAIAGRVQAVTEKELADVCFTANSGRSHFPERLAIIGENTQQIRDGLLEYSGQKENSRIPIGEGVDLKSTPVAFLFSGQGSQYVRMGRDLYETSPTFRRILDRSDEILREYLEKPLISVLYPESAERSLIDNTAYCQPALFVVGYALAELWRSWGVQPAIVMGHSVGEYTAACVAGAFGFEDGLRLIAERGRLMQSLPAGGRMAAVFTDLESIEGAIISTGARLVSIAAINGPELVVISGQSHEVQAVLDRLWSEGAKSSDLVVSHAFHSPLMQPIADAFERAAATVQYGQLNTSFVSTVTGLVADTKSIGAPDYWRRQMIEPVQFMAAIQTIEQQGVKTLLELGPNPVLLGMSRRCLGTEVTYLPSLRSGRGDWLQMLESLRALYLGGAEIDWTGFERDYPRRRVTLPAYPFQRSRYWFDSAPNRPKTVRPEPDASWLAASRAAVRQSQQAPIGINVATYLEKWQCLDRLTTAHAAAALRALGAFVVPGETHDADSLLHGFGIPDIYKALVHRWLERLAAAGKLREEGGRFVSDQPLSDLDLDARIEEAKQALADDPDLLAYVLNCGDKLTPVIAGRESPLETLFPKGSAILAERLYTGANINRYANSIVISAVDAAAVAWKGNLPFRVLEIGAGTGATSSLLLPLLNSDRSEYVFTDVSDLFVTRARERFGAFPFARFAAFDLEKEIESQGFAPHSFDAIVAVNAVHAVRELDGALWRIGRLLRPGGILVLVEVTRHHGWFDFTTGLIEGWQHFADDLRRDHPLLSPVQWQAALLERGFAEVVAVPEKDSPAEVFGQHVILARTPAGGQEISDSPLALPTDRLPLATMPPEYAQGSPTPAHELRQRLESALPDEQEQLMGDYVRGHVINVLQLAPDRRPSVHHRLMDLGLDSLMAVQLRNLLESGLGLEQSLPATLMFDYPTIASISTFLLNCLLHQHATADSTGTNEPEMKFSAARVSEVEALSEEEAEALLLKRLEQR